MTPSRHRTSAIGLLVVVLIAGIATIGLAGSAIATSQELDGSGTAEDPYVITTAEELQSIEDELDAHYVLGDDIDASGSSDWNSGAGFEPLGEFDPVGADDKFSGVFDGRNHTIDGLTIRRPSDDEVGLFAFSEGTVKNVHLNEASVSGERVVGVAVAENYGDIRGVSATGEVNSEDEQIVGGLVGWNREGTIEESWADVAVSNTDLQTGGLAGANDAGLSDSYARGDVRGSGAGGVVGSNSESVQRAYATGTVTKVESGSVTRVGGIAGSSELLVDAYWNVETSGQSEAAGEGSSDGATGLSTGEMTGANSASTMEAIVSHDAWLATDEYPVLQRNVEGISLDLDREIVTAGNGTNASVWLHMVGDRTEGATTVASYETADESVASISGGTITAESPGETTLTASHAGNETSASILVIAAEGISAIDAATSVDEVTAGDTVTVTGTFRNVDENETYRDAELTANEEAVTTVNVTVAGDSDGDHSFEWTPEEAGTYDLSIDGIDAGTVEVTEPATETTSGSSDGSNDGANSQDDTASDGNDDGAGGGLSLPLIVVGVLAVGSIGLLAGRRL